MKLTVKIDEQLFEVEVGDLAARPVRVMVDGEVVEVWPEEPAPAVFSPPPNVSAPVAPPLPSAAPAPVDHRSQVVPAPIPGVILSIRVKEGDSVVFGQELCILEAMKMKNQIRANRAGKIAAVCVTVGDQVRHGQVLMEYTD